MTQTHKALLTTLVVVLIGSVLVAGTFAGGAQALAQEPDTAAAPTPAAAEAIPPLPVPVDQVISGVIPDLPVGYMIVEGDIQIPIGEYDLRNGSSQEGSQAQAPTGTFELKSWPNGLVPYEFDPNVNASNQTAMQTAMTQWQNVAGVQFAQCNGNTCAGDFVHIQSSAGNNSAIGRQGGRQIINIVSWGSTFIMAHELGHALGLEHEQNRQDRDSFVRIETARICSATDASCNGGFCFDSNNQQTSCLSQFNLLPNAISYGGYDFDSVMHYGRAAFSNAPTSSGGWQDTITVLPPNDTTWQNAIGQRTHLSERDMNVMGCIYPRADWHWVSPSAVDPLLRFGSCFFPYLTIAEGITNTPSGGTLWIEPGTYAAAGTYSKPMTLKAPNGGVIISR